MISQTAKSEINRMLRDGLKPTPEDIIRLNAVGIAYDFCGEMGDIYGMPRVAIIGGLSFREPTIGHHLWISRVCSISSTDIETITAIRAFALTRSHTVLPDPLDAKAVKRAIDDFCAGELASLTMRQVSAAITYASYGADACACEYPAIDKDQQADERGDVLHSIGAGKVVEAMAMGLGLSLRDICELTRSQVDSVVRIALRKNGVNLKKTGRTKAEINFYMTRDEIRSRLEEQRNNPA